MLQKKKSWFTISVIVQILMFLYVELYDRIYGALIVQMPLFYQEKIFILKAMGILGGLYLLVYYFYRLFYLYKGTAARGKWTFINVMLVGVIALDIYDKNFPLLSSFLMIHLLLPYMLLLFAGICAWHDYDLIKE